MINYILENEKSNYKDEINNIILSNNEDVFDFFEPKDNPDRNECSNEEFKNVIVHKLIHGI